MQLTDEQLKEMKEKSKYCALCKEESLFNGCSVMLVSITESGEIVAPYETKDSGASVMIPLCAYHMILSQEGLIAVTTENRVIQAKFLTHLESQSDEELRKFVKKLNRAEKNPLNKMWKQSAKAIISARDFQKSMKEKKDEMEKNG